MTITKGVRAFAIFFIIYGILRFIISIGLLIYSIFIITLYSNSEKINTYLSIYTWTISIIVLLAAVFLFFSGYGILKSKLSSLKILFWASIFFIISNIFRITEGIIRILIFPMPPKSFYIYGINIFSILFWVFIIYFFKKESTKSQFNSNNSATTTKK